MPRSGRRGRLRSAAAARSSGGRTEFHAEAPRRRAGTSGWAGPPRLPCQYDISTCQNQSDACQQDRAKLLYPRSHVAIPTRATRRVVVTAVPVKHFLLASDFDQTLSFNDSGLILSELIGVPGFLDKVAGVAGRNPLPQGGGGALLFCPHPWVCWVRRAGLGGGRRPGPPPKESSTPLLVLASG